jgi:hypothetical protein
MMFLVTILDRWVDPAEATRITPGDKKDAIPVAAQLTMSHTEGSASYKQTF